MRPNIEALERLAYVGEHIRDDEFSTRHWFAIKDGKRTGCLLGHACSDEYFLAHGFNLAYRTTDGSSGAECYSFTLDGKHDYEAVARFFGVGRDQLAWMLALDFHALLTVTRQQLIQRIRSIIRDELTPIDYRAECTRKPQLVEFNAGYGSGGPGAYAPEVAQLKAHQFALLTAI